MNDWFAILEKDKPGAEIIWAWITTPDFLVYQEWGFDIGDAYALLRVPQWEEHTYGKPAYLLKTYFSSRKQWFINTPAWPIVAHLLQEIGERSAIIAEISDCYWDIYPRGMGPKDEKGPGRKVWDVLKEHGIRNQIPLGPWQPGEKEEFEALCHTPENGWLHVDDPVAEVRGMLGSLQPETNHLPRVLAILKEATRNIPAQNRIRLIESAIDLLEEMNQDAG